MNALAKALVPCVALLCITAIEIYALSRGINGVILTGVITVIAGIAGFKVRDWFKPQSPEDGKATTTKALPMLALACLLPFVMGCSVADEYVAADRLTYDAIAPEYLRYVDADTALDADQKARRHRTVATWKLRFERGGE